ncbi:MAG: hypothetical protein OCD02_19565 [Spirochaetaceae bacterium]
MNKFKATLNINSTARYSRYDRMIFGGFIEHFGRQIYGGFFEPGSPLADKNGFRMDVIEAIRELRIPVIRWPGGCFVDSYHWKKGVGSERQPYDDDRWGVREPNTFGTHEFIEFCTLLDAEPYICQNGLAEVQEMADWVAYCNSTTGPLADLRGLNGHPEPFNVKYWSVGNERSGKGYIDRVNDGTIAMKQVDPTIKVTCSGTHSSPTDLDPYLFETAAKQLDILSVHQYEVLNFEEHQTPDYLTCMMFSDKPGHLIKGVSQGIKKAGLADRLTIAFDEWNLRSWHHPGFPGLDDSEVNYEESEVTRLITARDKSLEPSLYTMADALFCASFFNTCLRYSKDVTMANIAPIVNQTGPLYVHDRGIVRRTHFHAMAMYSNLLKDHVVTTHIDSDSLTHLSESVAMVDAIATSNEKGDKWSIAMINRHPSEEVACTVIMENGVLDGKYTATILTGASVDDYNDIETPDRVVPVKIELTFKQGTTDLPPHSLTIAEITMNK